MNLGLENKIVLVTGASRGIGSAICEEFAKEGAHVAINYMSSKESAQVLADTLVSKYNIRTMVVAADMGDELQVRNMISEVEKELGAIDVLVNNAALCPSGPITSYTKEVWERTFAINVTGTFIASQCVVDKMLAEGRKGAIVNIASQAAFRGSTTGHLPYDSSKGAIVSFTIGLAREVAKQGIRINAVAPGLVKTEMVAKTWEERKERYLQTIPLYRIAEPSEIASVVVFMASDKASYITGSTIDVTGGMLMR